MPESIGSIQTEVVGMLSACSAPSSCNCSKSLVNLLCLLTYLVKAMISAGVESLTSTFQLCARNQTPEVPPNNGDHETPTRSVEARRGLLICLGTTPSSEVLAPHRISHLLLTTQGASKRQPTRARLPVASYGSFAGATAPSWMVQESRDGFIQ